MTSTNPLEIGDRCGEGHAYRGIYCETCALIDTGAEMVGAAISSEDHDERMDAVAWLLGNLPAMPAEAAEAIAIQAGLLEGPQ